ncbi:hypothetical protein BJ999_001396 [Actinomadura citrea]|uniref:Uncharacterized protein n=1 Tax=Actinomadura citrea TaxID=46158 RepID=A0A7Y9G6W9_9ACTN|nr:hypothetical protein [Actinomadura citrea]GGU07044.1 hypothetical protein GCM10010177_77960 [Actinomadura citrea]
MGFPGDAGVGFWAALSQSPVIFWAVGIAGVCGGVAGEAGDGGAGAILRGSRVGWAADLGG